MPREIFTQPACRVDVRLPRRIASVQHQENDVRVARGFFGGMNLIFLGSRVAVTDEQARYFGTTLEKRSLVPGEHALLGSGHFADWLGRTAAER